MIIDAKGLHFRSLNERIKGASDTQITVENCLGQRYIGTGVTGKKLSLSGVPGNALGAYLRDSEIRVAGNAQDAVGDTMDNGLIVVDGSIGDAAGYGMRGGAIYVRGDAGYRAGIHMKAYGENKPLIIIGGVAGSFLGEYQAGGTIIVLGLNPEEKRPLVGAFAASGQHGGRIYLRSETFDYVISNKIIVTESSEDDRLEIAGYLTGYCREFDLELDEILKGKFWTLVPDSKNPYKTLYNYN